MNKGLGLQRVESVVYPGRHEEAREELTGERREETDSLSEHEGSLGFNLTFDYDSWR